jgi:hypothetical protein
MKSPAWKVIPLPRVPQISDFRRVAAAFLVRHGRPIGYILPYDTLQHRTCAICFGLNCCTAVVFRAKTGQRHSELD